MKSRMMFILAGNNGATYIFNTSDIESIRYSLKFYKARTSKQKVMKLALSVFLVFLKYLPKLSGRFELKSVEETSHYLGSIGRDNIPFEFDGYCSALIAPTRDKIVVHHHGEYFHKFAFGRSQDKVRNEIGIYRQLGCSLENFAVSQMSDIYEGDGYCSFRLSNNHLVDHSGPVSDAEVVLALVELFSISSSKSCTVSQHVEGLKTKLASLDPSISVPLQEMLTELNQAERDKSIPLGLVHRDFKPWNINDEKGLLIYDFEEAVTDGPPLEDLFNYFIDPQIRYIPTKEMAAEIFGAGRVALYNDYLRRLAIDVDFQVLLRIYLVERVLLWTAQGETETASKYLELSQYLEHGPVPEKKKLIMIHLLNDYSGSPKVMSQVIRACQGAGHEVELYTGHGGSGFLTGVCEPHHLYAYRYLPNRYLVLLAYLWSQCSLFIKLLRYTKEDVVFYVNTMLPYGAALAGKLIGKPVYFHIHEISLQPRGLKWFLRRVVQHTANKVIFVSRAVKESESFRHVNQKVIYNALPAAFVDSSLESAYRWKPAGAFSVLMVSSLKDYKGLPEFFDIARLCESRHDVRFTLVLNADTHEIDSYFRSHDLPKNVVLAPRQKDLVPFYRETSLLLNLSRSDEWVETFGLTILEAMAFGIPVIVPPVGGPAELVTDGVEGYQLSCYDKDAVAARILELASDEKKCLKLSEHARKRSLDFSEETFNAEILKAIGE